MNRTAKWSLGTALVALLVLLAGWFLLVAPQRSEAAQRRDQTAAMEQTNTDLSQQIEILEAQFADLPKQRAQLSELSSRIPDQTELPSLIRQLSSVARTSGLELQLISPGAAAPLVPAGAATPSAADGGVTRPVTAIPLQLKAGGTFTQVELFLNRLEELQRALIVTGFTLAGGDQQAGPTAGAGAAATHELRGPLKIEVQARIFVNGPAGTGTAQQTQTKPTGPGAAPAPTASPSAAPTSTRAPSAS